jgi:hypothetical protein
MQGDLIMDIGRTDGAAGPGRIDGTRPASRLAKAYAAAASRQPDQVSLSARAELLAKAMDIPSVRLHRVNEVKQLIESGRFETDERLEGAMKKFMVENPDVLP